MDWKMNSDLAEEQTKLLFLPLEENLQIVRLVVKFLYASTTVFSTGLRGNFTFLFIFALMTNKDVLLHFSLLYCIFLQYT